MPLGVDTIKDLKLRGIRLKDLVGRYGTLLKDMETRGGTRWSAGEAVIIDSFHKSTMSLSSVAKMPSGCSKNIRRVDLRDVAYSGEVAPPPPPKKRSARPEQWACPGPLCERAAHRDTCFRECCSFSCWFKVHTSLTEKIVRAHYSKG